MKPVSIRGSLISMLVLICFASFGQDRISLMPVNFQKNETIVPGTVIADSAIRTGDLDDSLHKKNADSTGNLPLKQRKNRIRLIGAGNIAAYAGSMTALYQTWYKDYPQTHFHFFNDNREWQQVDKAGHAYSAYVASRASMEMWRWAGLSRTKRIWIGGMSGAVYQTVIETLDGFSAKWGWSWGDFGANVFGSGLLVSQELAWNEQRLSFKFSTHKRNYTDPQLNERAKDLYGKHFSETFLKDYNAQTLWLSANLKSFFKRSALPSWLNMAVGYGAEGMFGGEANVWTDKGGNAVNRSDVTRYRQLYLSPDIDLTRIKTRSKPLKVALFLLNSFKLPAPSLELSRGSIHWNWLHF